MNIRIWVALTAVLAILLGALPALAADDPVARHIMQQVEARDEGDNSLSEMEMVLIDRSGAERVRRIKSFRKDFGPDTYSIMFFLEPADVRETAFLNYDYDDPARDDDQWLYLPALRKSKRIAASDKSGSFMGSDFNYSDMTSRDIEEYEFTLLREEELEGRKVWLIEAVPISRATAEETGYEKSVVFVRQDNYVVVRAIHWTTDGKLRYLDVKSLEQIDGIWVNTEVQMTTRQGKKTLHSTVLRLHGVKFNQPFEESLFTVRRLEQGL